MNEEHGRAEPAMRPAKHKHVPVRTCVVCREQAGKRELMRVVRAAEGVFVDASGKRAGRGAYLCDKPDCWERAAAGEALAKALRTALNPEDRERIRKYKAAS
jgi:predicted RNA-binding protein YlxR (DUF448 family)